MNLTKEHVEILQKIIDQEGKCVNIWCRNCPLSKNNYCHDCCAKVIDDCKVELSIRFLEEHNKKTNTIHKFKNKEEFITFMSNLGIKVSEEQINLAYNIDYIGQDENDFPDYDKALVHCSKEWIYNNEYNNVGVSPVQASRIMYYYLKDWFTKNKRIE